MLILFELSYLFRFAYLQFLAVKADDVKHPFWKHFPYQAVAFCEGACFIILLYFHSTNFKMQKRQFSESSRYDTINENEHNILTGGALSSSINSV